MPQFAPKQIYDVHESFNRSLSQAKLARGVMRDASDDENELALSRLSPSARKFIGWGAMAVIALVAAGWVASRASSHHQAAGTLEQAAGSERSN
jgi:hypothetical protein